MKVRIERELHRDIMFRQVLIHGLFGEKEVHIDFSDKVRILIGENGTGKTTILTILNYLISGKLEGLLQIPFESVSVVTAEESEFLFTKTAIEKFIRDKRDIEMEFDDDALDQVVDELLRVGPDNIMSVADVSQFLRRPPLRKVVEENLFNTMIDDDLWEWLDGARMIFNWLRFLRKNEIVVLYLPTYRRIEADLNSLMVHGLNDQEPSVQGMPRYYRSQLRQRLQSGPDYSSDLRETLEHNALIRFGMDDISKAINSLLEDIRLSSVRGFARVSGDTIKYLISEKKKEKAIEFDENEVRIILQRSGNRLTDEEKEKIISMVNTHTIHTNPYLEVFLESLLKVYRGQRKYDVLLKRFVGACNSFLFDKEFVYDESRVTMGLFFKKDISRKRPLSLNTLSSGEKQMVALMAQCHLMQSGNLIVLIDEPELSLSITWQRRLLPTILNSPRCALLVAVTHSPFIFDNELKHLAQGAAEYVG